MKKVDFFRHNISPSDIDRATKVLQSIMLTTGSEVKHFEEKLSHHLGGQRVTGLTSCTGALHLGLQAFGIGPGDEVITTPLTFCATANAILHTGAEPVFVDVEPSTGNLDPDKVELAITPKTKAILPVHLYGLMCDMRRLRSIADAHGLVLIEDAAHCLEGRRDGVGVGELADAACFSFYATKSITSGEGGAISVHDESIDHRLKRLRIHGIDRDASDRYTKLYNHWDMTDLGWKYNMDNIQAALLIGQLEKAENFRSRRESIALRYLEAFAFLRGVDLFEPLATATSGWHLFTLRCNDRDRRLRDLQERGIGVAVNYRPVHLLSYYRERYGYAEGAFPIAEAMGSRTLSLPLFPSMEEWEIQRVIEAVGEVFAS